jgi:hypothetical protein
MRGTLSLRGMLLWLRLRRWWVRLMAHFIV